MSSRGQRVVYASGPMLQTAHAMSASMLSSGTAIVVHGGGGGGGGLVTVGGRSQQAVMAGRQMLAGHEGPTKAASPIGMKPTALATALETLIAIREPPFIWGPPGVGKSDVVRQVAHKMGLPVADIRAILLDPVDLRGLPHVNGDGRAHWAVPEFLPRDGAGILFLDELNAAAPAVQASCYQLVLDRAVGEYRLPDGWAIIGAGNRETDRAVVNRMPSALASRFIHLEFQVDVDDWCRWAAEHDVAPEVVAFIRFRPDLLHQFDPQQKAFPCPRTWYKVARIIAANPHSNVEFPLIAGTVGEGAATELVSFIKLFRELPNVNDILGDPLRVKVPSDPAVLHALATLLAHHATTETMDGIVAFANRMPGEFAVVLMKQAVTRDPTLRITPAFDGWMRAHGHVLV